MNKRILYLLALSWLLMLVMLPAGVLLAQTTVELPTDLSNWQSLIPVLIAVAAPLLMGALKKLITREVTEPDGSVVLVLPAWFPKWLPLPLGMALPWLADLLVQWLGGAPGVSPYVLMLLSGLPTTLREIGDQMKKFATGQTHQVVKLVTVNPERVGLKE